MTKILLILSVLVAFSFCTVVRIEEGLIRGKDVGTGTNFLGIPFVEKPKRFHSPEPAKPWSGVKDTVKREKECAQVFFGAQIRSEVEDCLYMNVYAPKNFQQKKDMPVMLYFHGGAYELGNAIKPVLNGTVNVAMTEDIVMVTVAYRLGIFGFLSHDYMRQFTDNGSSGNLGMQDQQMAMKWVQRNIEKFGGNKDNVMIFGESAGAGSVSMHLLMEESKPLFSKAAMESGAMTPWAARSWKHSELMYNRLMASAKCTNTDPKVEFDCLMNMSVHDILMAQAPIMSPIGIQLDWAPTIDGVMIKDTPRNMVLKGQMANKPILLGTNRNEGALFNAWLPRTATDDYVNKVIAANVSPDPAFLAKLEELFPVSDFKSPWWRYDAIMTDSAFACPTRMLAKEMVKKNDNVYLYQFTYYGDFYKMMDKHRGYTDGVFHSAEIPYVWQYSGNLMGKDFAVSKIMSNYWINFAKNGDPNGSTLPSWDKYADGEGDANIEINIPTKIVHGLKKERCDFLDSVMSNLPPYV